MREGGRERAAQKVVPRAPCWSVAEPLGAIAPRLARLRSGRPGAGYYSRGRRRPDRLRSRPSAPPPSQRELLGP